MITLYYMPGAASLAPHCALEEAGAHYELVQVVKEDGHVLEPAGYLGINPHGKVPALVDGSLTLYESAAVVMHVSDRFPEADLAPAVGTDERGLWYRWLTHLTNTVQPAFLDVFAPQRVIGQDEAAQATLSAHAAGRLTASRDWIAGELTGAYLVGGRFTSADLFLAMLTRWGRRLDEKWWDVPALGAHYERVVARPAVQRVYEQQGLTE